MASDCYRPLEHGSQFFVCRDPRDRRVPSLDQPPYMTEEGVVLIDRRVQGDRRTIQLQVQHIGIGLTGFDELSVRNPG